MKYLLDVNALIAWRHGLSPHHEAFHRWAARTGLRNLVTCGHSELGFLRVSMQVFGYTLSEAQAALAEMERATGGFVEAAPRPRLPAWADKTGRTSDGYLAQLAAKNGLRLTTFDTNIPGAVRIG
jgi:predicted nucleic acid-binding protein